MSIIDVIKEFSPRELLNAGIIETARKTGFVCPKCGNGTGENGTGINLIPNTNRFKCHRCGGNFSPFDLIAERFGYDGETKDGKSKTIEKAKELFKLTDDFISFSGENKKVAEPMTARATKPKKDYSKFYQLVGSQLFDFLENHSYEIRGLDVEDLIEVKAGIATAEDLKSVGENVPANSEYLIFPFDEKHFFMRSVDGDVEVKRGNTGGGKEIYTIRDVDFSKPFFVVEGIIDAISIEKAGFQAVATDGATNYKILIQWLKSECKDNKPPCVIMLFDNDKAGRDNAKKAVDELNSVGYMAKNYILHKEYDANEFLQKDFNGFKERLTEIYSKVKKEFSIGNIEVLADVFDELDAMSGKFKNALLKWGFPVLDEKLPMLPGCYLLGALPSLGKTTFALNVAANICDQGEPVLYISYEPTINQIAIKDLAGYWFKKIWNNHRDSRSTDFVPSAIQIMLGRYSDRFAFDEMKEVRAELKDKRRNFYFLQGRKETAENLIGRIKPYIERGVKFIVIDYIQLIQGSDTKKDLRVQIDETLRALQIFQAENDLVILFISSFNRENYRKYACFESFKESGGLEYTADAILALQFEFADEKDRSDNAKFQEKKQAQPRDMELVILKNRYGIDFVDKFAYHSKHETFIEKIPEKNSNVRNNERIRV